MKRCQYCGKEYTDKMAVCPVDGKPLIDPEAIPRPTADRTVFQATLTSPVSLSGQYRIYVRGDDLIFICIEAATRSILNSIHGFLGPLGAVIPLCLWLFSRPKTKDWKERLETTDPEDLIQDDEKNFRLHLSEVREAALDPPSNWRYSGKSAGCLKLRVRQDEKMKLELATSDDVETARRLLALRLPSLLQINVEWNEANQCFQKRHPHAPA